MQNKQILNRVYMVCIIFVMFTICIIYKIFQIQFVQGYKYEKIAKNSIVREVKIPAARGNIYSSEGYLLATSVAKYDIRLDLVTIPSKIFYTEILYLGDSLSRFLNLPKRYIIQKLKKERKKKNRYLLLAKNISYNDFERIKKFPILKYGAYKGGLIAEQKIIRKRSLGKVAERIIGYDDYRGRVGIEGSFSMFLKGKDGRRLKQKIGKKQWKPLNNASELEPVDGFDIYTTIDVEIQDIAHNSLLKSLKKFQADHGCVVIMEVQTGEVKAIVNLGKDKKGGYYEKRNYAVYEATEPGSTFKLMVLMAAMEDGKLNLNAKVDTKNGKLKFYNDWVKDSNGKGYGKINTQEVFEKSSNTGMAKLIYDRYHRVPELFVNRLYKMGLASQLKVSIIGEGTPRIPSPQSAAWSGISLPWMAYGYGIVLTPLQVLSFYNAIANNGKSIKPIFVKQKKRDGVIYKTYQSQIMNYKICSDSTLKKAKKILEGVVKRGTAKNIYTDKFSIAGKTGTCQTNYWKGKDNKEYIASFAGYFPADNPKYSCIVTINNPNKKIGYYGRKVAAPVFSEVAHKLFVKIPTEQKNKKVNVALKIEKKYVKLIQKDINKKQKFVIPNVKGMHPMNAISILENMGLKVKLKGIGIVEKQSLPANTKLNQQKSITLVLKQNI